jgi:signal transduction histidine kinase/nitroreductase
MDVFEAINSRRSVRRYRPEPPAVEAIERIIAAAHAAPYGTKHDERHFVVLGGEAKERFVAFLERRIEELMPALREASPRQVLILARSVLPTVRSAPVIVVVYAERSEGGVLLGLGSVSVAIENLLLAAYAEGLGTCWVTGATHLADDIAEHLGMDPGMRLVGLVPLGYPLRAPERGPTRPTRLYWRGFPGREENPVPKARAEEIPGPALPRDRAPTILLVDDNPTVLEFLAGTLEAAGYNVVLTADATAALDLVQQHQPDLVIADAFMPGMTGFQLCHQVQQEVTGLLPVLLTTTSYTLADEAYALEGGADGMLDKPVRAQTLLAYVRSLLRTKELYDQVGAQKQALAQSNEELRRLEEAQENLVNLIVHDLRTPLTSILGGLRLVADNGYEEKLTHEMIPMAQNAGETMMGLVNDLLDVAKLEAGQMALTLTPVPVGPVLDQVREATLGSARERGLELTLEKPEPELYVQGDADFLRRMLINLVGNSLKFTLEGSVRVEAEAEPAAGQVVLRVRDTGIGIPPEARERIFQKFGQVEGTRGQRRGTGLGLTFVKMAAEALGGSVAVDSEEGKGSVFTVRLPRAAEPHPLPPLPAGEGE